MLKQVKKITQEKIIEKLKIIEIYVHRGEFEEARNHFESKRNNIENLNMADLVNAWFDQGRVFDRIEMKWKLVYLAAHLIHHILGI